MILVLISAARLESTDGVERFVRLVLGELCALGIRLQSVLTEMN